MHDAHSTYIIFYIYYIYKRTLGGSGPTPARGWPQWRCWRPKIDICRTSYLDTSIDIYHINMTCTCTYSYL